MSSSAARHRKAPRYKIPSQRGTGRHRGRSRLAAIPRARFIWGGAALAGSVLVASAWSGLGPWISGAPGVSAQDNLAAFSRAGSKLQAGGQASDLLGTIPSARAASDPVRIPTPARSAGVPAKAGPLRPARVQPPPVYRNPFRDVSGLIPQRVDMGVDFAGAGPVYALGDAVITSATSGNYGWPGGGWITYQLTSGPAAGLMVFLAEDVTPLVQVGQHVTSSTVIARMFDGGDGIETGWAQASGFSAESQLAEAGGISGSGPFPTLIGINFEQLLRSLGVPDANNWGAIGYGVLPAAYPSRW